MRCATVAALLAVGLMCSSAFAAELNYGRGQAFETFDSLGDNGWKEVGRDEIASGGEPTFVDVGWDAGGGNGRAGGIFGIDGEVGVAQGYYSGRFATPLTLNEPFAFSVDVAEVVTDPETTHIGFMNDDESHSCCNVGTFSYMGVALERWSDGVIRGQAGYHYTPATARGFAWVAETVAADIARIEYQYDPNEGDFGNSRTWFYDADGNTMTDTPVDHPLDAAERNSGASFNSFGFTGGADGDRDWRYRYDDSDPPVEINSAPITGESYYDNATYTIPEPASIGLLLAGGLLMLRRKH